MENWCFSQKGDTATLKGRGEVDGAQTVSASLTLAGYNLRDRNAAWAEQWTRATRPSLTFSCGIAGRSTIRRSRGMIEMTVLQDQTALITGGSRGIGRAIVKILAGAGRFKVAFTTAAGRMRPIY